MKTTIFWFSGTGNSLVAARRIAAALGDAELVPVARAIANPPSPVQRAVIVFPVYAFGPPEMVVRFVRQMQVAPGGKVYSVATMGGNAGASHTIIRKELAARGISHAGGWSLVMPSNCISLSAPPKADKQQKIFAKTEARIAAIAGVIAQDGAGAFEDATVCMRWMWSLVYGWAIKQFPNADKKLCVTDTCTSCGRCVRVCPADNIKLENGRPVWLHHCQACYACINLCPTKAIEYGRKTIGVPRYCHPQVTADDIASQRNG